MPGISLAPPPDVLATEAEPEPEPVAEAADWGAQALVSLGTQAGVRIPTGVPSTNAPGEPADPGVSGIGPPLGHGATEDFAFAPPPVSTNQWSTSQPPSQGEARAPTQAMGFAPPPDDGSLEDQLVEDEQDSSQYAGGMDSEALSQPDGVFREIVPPPEEGMGQFANRDQEPVLEATAFSVVGEQEGESAPHHASQEVPQTGVHARRPARPRSALRSHSNVEDGSSDEESWRPSMSRRKKIIIVMLVAAGLGAAAASLLIALTEKSPARHRPPVVAKRVTKKVGSSVARAGNPAESATPKNAALPGKLAPAAEAAGARKPAVADKAVGAGKSAENSGAAQKLAIGKTAASVKPAVAVKAAAAAKPGGLGPVPVPSAVVPGGAIRVTVASQPAGAAVWIDGQERGTTPCMVDLKPGPARVVLVRAGHLSSQSTLEVREGAKIDKTLTPVEPPMTGDARFRAECKTQGKLPIVVDGKETGILCPFSKMRVDPGTHKIGLFIPATGKIHTKEVILFAGVRSIVFGD